MKRTITGICGIIAINVNAQTNLQFSSANATVEGAIQIHWTSQSNHLYQVQYANALGTNVDGSTAWLVLYDAYPSQGTNTFIGDFGNYNVAPSIPHPKYSPMRFYRVMDEGKDSLASDPPMVSVVSPTNGSSFGELTITVVAATDQPVISGTTLYVDGQQMRPADSFTNWSSGSTNYEMDTYNINSCEWANGTHTLFATAENESGYGDPMNASPILIGHAASPFVPVFFSNLVTRISFSQPSFDPTSGQTQQVNAVFAANCNWTLQIQNVGGTAVRTVTGSGTTMLFNWDGNGDGGTSLPAGIYYYYITAQTNGLSSQIADDGSGDNGGGDTNPPAPLFTSSSSANLDSTELWAMPADGSGGVAPLAIYPPGFDTNDLLIFEAPLSVVESQSTSLLAADSSDSTDNTDAYSGPASQPSPSSPQRPPTNPVRGLAGTFAVAYQTFAANGTNGFHLNAPPNKPSFPAIKIQNTTGGTFLPRPQHKPEVDNFVSEMQHWGWSKSFVKADNQLALSDMEGSGTPFNQGSLGVLLTHATYGTTGDQYANGAMQMYFPITSGSSASWLRMSDMNLGGVGANGLKWMAIPACHSLYHINWDNMQLNLSYPYNSYLHLLLGSDTDSATSNRILQLWARYMSWGTSTNYSPLTVRSAWYQAAQDAYKNAKFPPGTLIQFIVAGDEACFADSLQTWYSPDGNWTRDNPTTVFSN